MCMMVYLSCDHELPEIPRVDGVSLLSIKKLVPTDAVYQKVQQMSERDNVYYAGSWQGCGCGFSYGIVEYSLDDIATWPSIDEKNRQELIQNEVECERKGRGSVESLFAFIRTNMQEGKKIDLYSFWADNEENDIQTDEVINPEHYRLGDSFCFIENQHIRFE